MDKAKDLKMENNGFGPISQLREKIKPKLAAAFVVVVFVLAFVVYRAAKKIEVVWQEDVIMCCGILSAIILGEFIRRLCLFAEEYQHVHSRYKGSTPKAFKACISGRSTLTTYVFGITTSVYAYVWLFDNTKYTGGLYLATAIFGSVGTYLIDLKSQTKVELSDLNEIENKHVADGLAWSYYFGYLNLLFQHWDTIYERAIGMYQIEGKDIRDVIEKENHKLFIIIPKDGLCFNFIHKKDPRIHDVAKMPQLKIMRAGVQERRYENTVYEIKMADRKKKYVLVEYATPLLSMYEMAGDDRAAFDQENLEEQVMQFYNKLKAILSSDEKCRGKYELVLLGRNDDVRAPRLGDIIWEKLKFVE